VKQAAEWGAPSVIVFSGNRNGTSDGEGLDNCVLGLRKVMPAAEDAGLLVCMELLNSKLDHPGYMCDHTNWGVELVKRVGSPHFRLLYDIYHMQIMEGDVIRTIRENARYIGHLHTAGNPGRHEIDDTQELNYRAIAKAVADTGFAGYLAHEFTPTRHWLTSLREAIELCDV
jgi:hydroxypyruvate isomerase